MLDEKMRVNGYAVYRVRGYDVNVHLGGNGWGHSFVMTAERARLLRDALSKVLDTPVDRGGQ